MAGYIGPAPVPQATQNREAFTATSGQTSFATAGYTPQFIDVYLNGVKLAAADYTATNGSDVVLASGAASGDILEVVAFSAFTVADQAFTGTTTAANLTVTGTFTSRGIDDNADAVAITIDSSENVGIGTTADQQSSAVNEGIWFSPGSNSSFSANSTPLIINRMGTGGNDRANITLHNNGTARADIGTLGASNGMYVAVGGSEAMRIDSSGNLLVGTTTTDPNTAAGAQLSASGRVLATVDGGNPGYFNRLSSDGEIVRFEKDGTTVGSIATANSVGFGTTYLEGPANSSGLLFGNIEILPHRNGARSDGLIDIGDGSYRFKDLYLSGGIQFDSRSNKLDDYEEGTWTPDLGSSVPSSIERGYYCKIGKAVFIEASITVGTTSSTSHMFITNFPFTSSGDTLGGFSPRYTNFGSNEFLMHMNGTDTLCAMYNTNGNTRTYAEFSGKRIDFYGFYFT